MTNNVTIIMLIFSVYDSTRTVTADVSVMEVARPTNPRKRIDSAKNVTLDSTLATNL